MREERPASARGDAGGCPICDRPAAADARDHPFCSVRCRMVDLGRWFDGAYVIPGGAASDVELLDGPAAGLPDEAGEGAADAFGA